MSVVGEGGAEAGRPTLAGVRAALLVERRGAEVLVAGGEQILVQDVTLLRRVGR